LPVKPTSHWHLKHSAIVLFSTHRPFSHWTKSQAVAKDKKYPNQS
jgi:hypothetical protein